MKNLTTPFGKLGGLVRAHWAAIQLVRDPSRLDKVFELDTFIPDRRAGYQRIADAMRAKAGPAMAQRHRLRVDLPALRLLPEGTFGRTAADFLDDNGLDPRSIPALESPGEIEWTQAHLYETHDIWHVATGFATDIAGEVGLQAFYAAQLPGRLSYLLIAGGLFHSAYWFPDEYDQRMAEIVRGWESGRLARPLFGVRWDLFWERSLAEVRSELGIPEAPQSLKRSARVGPPPAPGACTAAA
jgi:ubiquinone biosynthesis protein COQ4